MIGYREPRVLGPVTFIVFLGIWGVVSLLASCSKDGTVESNEEGALNQIEANVEYIKDRRYGICYAMVSSCNNCLVKAIAVVDCTKVGL